MPSRLAAPVLTVDAGKMHKVDPRNVESLFGMWMVFSKCAESIEEGKRFENLSWRLWNRETFCCEAQPHLATTPAIHVRRHQPSPKEIPSLSSSVDSAASEDTEKTQTIRPATFPRTLDHRRHVAEDSALSRSRGKAKHITSFGLEKMIINIKEKTDIEPLSPTIAASVPTLPGPVSDITPRPSSPFPDVEADKSSPESHLQNSSDSCFSNATLESAASNGGGSDHGSDTSVSSSGLAKSASVIKGFSSSQLSSSFRAKSTLSPQMAVRTQPQPAGKVDVQKKSNMFMLGGSSGEDESSFEDRIARQPKQSSLSNSLKCKPLGKPKKPSYKEIVQSRRIEEADTEDEDAIESGDEDDGEASESAIEEDDAAWEDSDSESGHASPVDKNMFLRVESQANLTSQRSMLTMQLHNPQRATALANAASRSSPALRRSRTSSPNGPSHPDSSDEQETEPVLTMRGPQSSRPMPINTTTTTASHAPAHSPRTTRRNMLATELPESLRKHLLWERKQKSTTANAFLKRRHTARDMAHLQEYPDLKPDPMVVEASKNNSWNHYFDGPWEYHTKGW